MIGQAATSESLPVRISEEHLLVYDRSLTEVAKHVVLQGHSGYLRIDPAHTPPRDHEEQMQRLRERFAELGEVGVPYLAGLESKQRNTKCQALQVLGLLHAYQKGDLLRAVVFVDKSGLGKSYRQHRAEQKQTSASKRSKRSS